MGLHNGLIGLLLLLFACAATAAQIDFGRQDVGRSFTVNFQGSVSEQEVPNLTSQAVFTLTDFGDDFIALTIALSDTSTAGITSRTTALGFNVSPQLRSARASGLFSEAVIGGRFPNRFGEVDVCLTDGNKCQGGGNGGVTTGNTGTIRSVLTFRHPLTGPVTLSQFGVRMQSIAFFSGEQSGTGIGTFSQVPESSTWAMFAIGLALLAASAATERLAAQGRMPRFFRKPSMRSTASVRFSSELA